MQSACQISDYAHYARSPVLQLKQRTDDFYSFTMKNIRLAKKPLPKEGKASRELAYTNTPGAVFGPALRTLVREQVGPPIGARHDNSLLPLHSNIQAAAGLPQGAHALCN
jgi:hypothetical protein